VPYGGTEMGSTPPLLLFEQCSRALKNAKLRHQDFRRTLSDVGSGDFLYVDPPYFTASERTFVEYGRKSFGQKDLDDLIGALVIASERGAHVALTYSAAMPLRSIPRTWSRIRFNVTRNVGGFSGSRKQQSELLYANYGLG
jgi:DNA adenine methylase